jgi:hypothetical protein
MNAQPAPWYHGSPFELTHLLPGSTITQDRRLAEVFSHKPTLVSLEDDGMIRHNGNERGLLYRVDEEVLPADILPHPRSSMPPGKEWLAQRELRVALIGPVSFLEGELLTDAEIEVLRRRIQAK